MPPIEGRARRALQGGVLAIFIAAACALIAAQPAYDTVDYAFDAGPPLKALVRLDFGDFFATQPQMGALSLLLRWPFVALADQWSGSEIDEYRFGLFACLLVTAAIGVALAIEMRRRSRSPAAIGLALGLWFLNPAALQAANIGHPEELVGGALCVLAVLVSARATPVPGGVALGLALATKQWALAAAPPVLLGARNALKTGALALAVWLPLELPLLVGNFDAYKRVAEFGVQIEVPIGLWWPLTGVLSDEVIVHAARPLILIAAVTVAGIAWRRVGAWTIDSQLALLALVLLLRTLLDPTANLYFAAPFVMALIAFEALSSERAPVVSIVTIVALAITFHSVPWLVDHATISNAFYLAWGLPLIAWLWRSLTRQETLSGYRGSSCAP